MAIEGIFGTVQFGKVRGGFRTFHQITKKSGGRFHEHAIHLSKPLTEFSGDDLIDVTIALVLNGAWSGNPHRMLAELHFYQEAALAAPLVIGGKPMGPGMSLFVVRSLNETHSRWLKGGILIHAEIDLELKEYVAFAGIPGLGGFGSLVRGIL